MWVQTCQSAFLDIDPTFPKTRKPVAEGQQPRAFAFCIRRRNLRRHHPPPNSTKKCALSETRLALEVSTNHTTPFPSSDIPPTYRIGFVNPPLPIRRLAFRSSRSLCLRHLGSQLARLLFLSF